jgi:pimeloyl-ACP methyl ester carboxylesterase
MVSESFRGGSGPPLVLLHSGFSIWAEWRSTIGFLTGEREVLAPTLPGSAGGPPLDLANGRTMLGALADHVESLLAEAGWDEPVAMAGSSFGAVTALELAARGQASSVVALSPPWVVGRGIPYFGALFATPMTTLRLTGRVRERLPGAGRALGLLLHGSTRPLAIEPEDARAMMRSFSGFPFFEVARRSRLGGPGAPAFDRIGCPVTFAWGGSDRVVPGWMHRRWEAALPRARVHSLAGLPHVPHLRDPERVARLILDASE